MLVAAAEMRDHETGLVSEIFSWFQSRQIYHETHETKEPFIFLAKGSRPRFCINKKTHWRKSINILIIFNKVHIFCLMVIDR